MKQKAEYRAPQDVSGRSCASLRPRYSVHPERKRVLAGNTAAAAQAKAQADEMNYQFTEKNGKAANGLRLFSVYTEY